ncbi:MAG TPA: CoA transferase, partial [Acidimicrobiales bacterium]|nr:CoA transferase [Acidimicrobiales bacterium]
MRQLLADITVVELAEGVAGGYCAKLFADLGAAVVKVERPGGDPLRRRSFPSAPPRGEWRGGTWMHLNTNKRSSVVDPADPDGSGRLWGLLERADLVIASGPGSLGDWGLGWEELHEKLPGLSVVSISGFGATGPYSTYKWDDLIAQAMSGTLLLQDRSDQDPLKLPGQMALCFVGSMAALGALAAVTVARADGGGAFVDCAAIEALATIPAKATTLLSYHYRDGAPRPAAEDNSGMTLIPMGVFPCGDGHVAMMSTPQQLREMLDVLDDDDLRAAFARPDAYERGETKEVVDAALYPWLLSRTRAEATAAAQAAGWPLAGVNSPYEVLAADHLHQRGFWVHADDPVAGAIDLPGPPAAYAEGGWALRRLAPDLGELDAEVDGSWPPSPPSGPGSGGTSAPSARGAVPPLTGLRVLDMTTVWAGPYATMLLADLGAEVIRVENPWVLPPTTKGYQARPTISNLGLLGSGYGPVAAGRPDRPYNRHAMNNSLGRNKLSCTIDTRRPAGRELLMRLAEKSDVFIENFKASGLAHMGIQVSELQARNPRLVVLRMPPTGATGDWSSYAGFGAQFDGLCGLTWLCGHRGTDLVTSPATTYMDAASGPAGAFAAFAALHYRDAAGRGQVIELAQMENVIQHLGDVYVDCQLGVKPDR